MRRPLLMFGLSTTMLALACGDSGSGGAGGGGGESATGGGGASPAQCPAETLCLDIDKEGEIPEARLAVVWFRLEGTTANDPTIAFESVFDASATYLELDLSAVELPPDIDLACERDCPDAATCPCVGAFQAGVAYVMVVVDDDQSGAIDPVEVANADLVVGIANAALVWSATSEPSPLPPFSAMFPSGVEEGLGPYRIGASTSFEPAQQGEIFGLKIGPDVF